MDTKVRGLSSPTRRVMLGTRFYVLFALFVLVQFPLHELGHLVAYQLAGIPAEMSLNRTTTIDPGVEHVGAVLAGPLLTIAIAVLGAWGFWHFRRFRLTWAAVALSGAMFRLLLYLWVAIAVLSGSAVGSNDEPLAAELLGLPDLTLVALFTVPVLIVIATVMAGVESSRLRRRGHIALMLIITFAIATAIEQGIQPLLFPA